MHDIRAIREAPEAFDAALKRRGLDPVAAIILALDESRRSAITAAETAQADRNAASKQVGAAKASGDEAEFERLRALVAAKKDEGAALEAQAKDADDKLRDLLLGLPNLPYDDVPDGTDEDDNVEVNRWGSPRDFDFTPLEHYEIPGAKPGFDFETAAKVSGSRFMFLSGAIAAVHRALGQFMLTVHTTENGLTETWTPVLVNNRAMVGTDKLPKFGEDSFYCGSFGGRESLARKALDSNVTDADIESLTSSAKSFSEVVAEVFERADTFEQFWLIPTSEVTLTYSVAESILDEADLPRRLTAHTQCFRSEAGSAGRDTAGMLRQHQFEKVEMVSVVHPDHSDAELDRMTKCAEGILERLGLPYRTVVLCAGDMGFGARRTYDIEVWLPGQNSFREISSCSTTAAFQARRMNARFRPEGGGKPEFVHTLNGSGLAVGRALIAVLENGQQANGSIDLPEALHPFLLGKTRISAEGALE